MITMKHNPVGKRTAYQIFRAHEDAMAEMKKLKSAPNGSKNRQATVASEAKESRESSSAKYKEKYEELVCKEEDRPEA